MEAPKVNDRQLVLSVVKLNGEIKCKGKASEAMTIAETMRKKGERIIYSSK